MSANLGALPFLCGAAPYYDYPLGPDAVDLWFSYLETLIVIRLQGNEYAPRQNPFYAPSRG